MSILIQCLVIGIVMYLAMIFEGLQGVVCYCMALSFVHVIYNAATGGNRIVRQLLGLIFAACATLLFFAPGVLMELEFLYF